MVKGIRIFCVVDGDKALNAFPVEIAPTETVGNLKDLIKAKKSLEFNDIDANKLILWRVSIPDDDDNGDNPIRLNSISEKKVLRATGDVSDIFEGTPPKKMIHIIVERPSPVHTPTLARASDESRSSSSLSDDLRSRIKAIEDKFFAPASPASDFLNKYVEEEKELPFTKDGIKGLPLVKRRGAGKEAEPRPSLLFLDLPKPPSNTSDAIDERFQSNAILQELGQLETQDLPVFGVSGCGKTRSVIEVLYLQWGFYFNASQTDLGSNDLYNLIKFIEDKTSEAEEDISTNTNVAKNITRLLFLSRLMVLKYCLKVQGCRQTFSSASWALLQVCPNMFRDVFEELFTKLFKKMTKRILIGSELASIIQETFESVHGMLAELDYPNFSSKSKFRLMIDEAQILGDKKPKSFESSSSSSIRRPMLSPVLHGFRTPGNEDKLTVLYCGTGLSVKTLDWVRGSGDGVKSLDSSEVPKYIQFSGWDDVNSVQAYVERIKDTLSDEESKEIVEDRIPLAAVEMLHKRLTGRFRPIVTAIEGILKGGEWNTVIDKVEEILTSYGEHERPGNLCGELIRLETKMDRHLKNFSKRFSIKEALGLFLFGHYHLGKSSIEFEHTDAWLVEAAFGRIKFLEGVPKTVLDEPFVLKATINYFQVKDPLLISSLQRAMQLADSPSAQGSMWELVMPSIFVETFNNPVTRNLNFWSLSTTLPDQLVGNVTIVGYKEDKRLTMPYPELTIHQFMKAHAENGSKQGDESMPPFYFPDPQVTGPDIMFFVKINNNIYPCFVQLKLRKTLSGSNAKAALETVSSKTIQEKMKTEHEKQKKTSASSDQQQPQLQDYCPNGKYISMVIVYPAKVTNFQAIQPDPKLELEGLERVSINIDGSNFSKIFPSGHVKFLNILKEYKRRSEDQLPQQSKRSKTDHDS